MSEHEPEILGRVKTEWYNDQVVMILPDKTRYVYALEALDALYTTFYQHRRMLAGAQKVSISTPEQEVFYLSGEGAVLLYAFLRELRHARGISDPEDLFASSFLRDPDASP